VETWFWHNISESKPAASLASMACQAKILVYQQVFILLPLYFISANLGYEVPLQQVIF